MTRALADRRTLLLLAPRSLPPRSCLCLLRPSDHFVCCVCRSCICILDDAKAKSTSLAADVFDLIGRCLSHALHARSAVGNIDPWLGRVLVALQQQQSTIEHQQVVMPAALTDALRHCIQKLPLLRYNPASHIEAALSFFRYAQHSLQDAVTAAVARVLHEVSEDEIQRMVQQPAAARWFDQLPLSAQEALVTFVRAVRKLSQSLHPVLQLLLSLAVQ